MGCVVIVVPYNQHTCNSRYAVLSAKGFKVLKVDPLLTLMWMKWTVLPGPQLRHMLCELVLSACFTRVAL